MTGTSSAAGASPPGRGASYPATQARLAPEARGRVFVDSVDDATLLENAARLRADFAAMVDPA